MNQNTKMLTQKLQKNLKKWLTNEKWGDKMGSWIEKIEYVL